MPHKRAKRSVREQLRSERGTDLPPPKSSTIKKRGEKGDISNEALPKSLARVLDAVKIREEYRERKRRNEDSDDVFSTNGQGGKRRKLDGKDDKSKSKKNEGTVTVKGILPRESLQHYNKRVEASMRPLVRSAVQSSLAVSRNAERKEREERHNKKQQQKPSKQTTRVSRKDDDGDDDNDDESSDSNRNPERPANDNLKHTLSGKPKATEFETYSTSVPRRLNDIAQAPPQLKPVKARGQGKNADHETKTGTRKKNDEVLSMAQRHMMEVEREKAIQRYRELKAKREADKEKQR
ncbi:hypothetical protein K435DRAFT_759300 [Dendrothele bispora CBS 962.96]|uniref:Uncharacterized protein n=1 Tax=Dendrothele bispora (strain CBS 962.96) TaxID=1314807 RepID=A0A4S8LRD3_DENBC|nr:hypothetical protein K435DRAFT_759300 [Dendrothele bispora CBS 962.96]